jgi:hypothetical protein
VCRFFGYVRRFEKPVRGFSPEQMVFEIFEYAKEEKNRLVTVAEKSNMPR